MTTPLPPTGRLAIALGLALVANGCASSVRQGVAEMRSHASLAHDPESLRAGDVLAVQTQAGNAALPETTLHRIAADGRANLPELGSIVLAGRSMLDLGRLYDALPASDVRTIVLHERQGARIAVAGEVRRPGFVQYGGAPSVTDVIAAVGGTTAWADEGRVEVIRARNGVAQRLRVSLASGGDAFRMQPGDLIVVPTEPLSRVRPEMYEP